MSSLRMLPNSPYWVACYTLADGTRTQRSTKVPIKGLRKIDFEPLKKILSTGMGASVSFKDQKDVLSPAESKKLAQRIADMFEQTEKAGREGRLIESQIRKTMSDVFARVNREELPSSTIAEYFQNWLNRKELEAGAKTHQRYSSVVKQFLAQLGTRAKRDISHLSSKDICDFRDGVAKRLTPGTANISLKIIRSALTQAKRDGLIDVNEAERVTLLKKGESF